MKCSLPYKEAVNNSKSFLVDNGALESMQSNRIKDIAIFRRVNRQLSKNAKDVYGIDGKLWLEDDGEEIAYPNIPVLRAIDNKRKELGWYEDKIAGSIKKTIPKPVEEFVEKSDIQDTIISQEFQEEPPNEFYSLDIIPTRITTDVHIRLLEFADKLGIKIQVLNDLLSSRGANGIADIKNFIIKLQNGKEDALAEEVCHFFVEGLDQESDLYKQMLDIVPDTRLYKEVVRDYNAIYKGDVKRLKHETIAKLISLYLTDKVAFKHYVAKDERIVEKIIRWIKEFFGVVRKDDRYLSFIESAENILSLNTKGLRFDNAYSEMFAMPRYDDSSLYRTVNLEKFQTLNGWTLNHDRIFINVNDTILDYAGYKPGDKNKGKMFKNLDQAALSEYYKTANLTAFGKELQDKIALGVIDPEKIVFYTSLPIQTNNDLLHRLQEEFQKDGKTFALKQVKQFKQLQDIDTNRMVDVQETMDDFYEKEVLGRPKVIFIDNESIDGENFNIDNTFKYYNKGKKYKTFQEVLKEEHARESKERESKKYFDELSKIPLGVLEEKLSKLNTTLSNVRRNINTAKKVVDKLSTEDTKSIFKTEDGLIDVPSKNVIYSRIESNIKNLTLDIENFVATIHSTAKFFEDIRNAQVEKYNTSDITEDQAQLMIYELNKIIGFAEYFNSYVDELLDLVRTTPNTQFTKELLFKLQGEIQETIRLSKIKSVEALNTRLGSFLDNYNQNKYVEVQEISEQLANNKFKNGKELSKYDRLLLEDRLNKVKNSILTTEKISDILTGKEKDLNALTIWIKTLGNSSDPLIASVEKLIKTVLAETDANSLQENQNFVEEFDKIVKDGNLTQKDIDQIVTTDMDWVFDSEAGKWGLKPRKKLLNRFKNLHKYEEQEDVVKEARKKYYQARFLNQSPEEIEKLHQEFLDAVKNFNRFKLEYWNQEYTPEYYKRYETLINKYGSKYEEAIEEVTSRYQIINELKRDLISASDKREEELIKEIAEVEREIKFLRLDINMDGSEKTENQKLIAEILREKYKIDYGDKSDKDSGVYEFVFNNDKFKKDFIAFINSLSEDQLETADSLEFKAQILGLETNYSELLRIAREKGILPVIEWLEKNTVIRYSEEFYNRRQEIVDTIGSLISKIKEIKNEPEDTRISELWNEIFILSTPFRDENGWLEGSNATIEIQQKIKEFDQQIEDIKAEVTQEFTKNKTLAKLFKDLKEAVDELKSIQSKEVTQDYIDEFYHKCISTGFVQDFGKGIHTNTDFLTLINTEDFGHFVNDNPDHPMSKWFLANHILVTDVTKMGEIFTVWKPTYLWMKITPSDPQNIHFVPNRKYSDRKVKDKYITEKIDFVTWDPIFERYLPRLDASEFIDENYTKLMSANDSRSGHLRRLLDHVTKYHLNTQIDSLWDARIGWFLPSVLKRVTEGNAFKNRIADIADFKSRFEEGEGNYRENEEGSRAPGLTLKNIKANGWKMINDKFSDVLNGLNMSKPVEFDEEGKVKKERLPNVAVPFSQYMEPEIASSDLQQIMMWYRGGVNSANKMVELIPTTNLVQKVLEDTNQPERLKAIKFIDATKFRGFNKQYEVGKSLDRFATMVRKANSFGSLGDITGFFNNVKNNFQGRLQNFINSEFSGWSNNKAMRKASLYPKNNLIYFLNQAEKDVSKREIDYHIMAFFLPKEYSTLLGKGAVKRFIGTYVGSLSSMSHLMEFVVTSNSLYAHLFYKQVERQTESGKEVKYLKDILTTKDNVLSIQPGWKDSITGRDMTDDYLIKMKTQLQSIMEYTQGKIGEKTLLSTTTIGQSILYFKNWLIPALRRRFDKKRANFMLDQDVEGYWLTFWNVSKAMFTNMLQHRELNWHTFSDQEKANYNSAVKELAIMLISTMVIGLLFGFDPNDKDKFKKLRNKSYAEQTALLLTLQVKQEVESFSPVPYLNIERSMVPSVLTEGTKFMTTSPFVGYSIISSLMKSIQYAFTFGPSAYYDQDIPRFNIEKGDSKSWYHLRKVIQLDDLLYMTNPEGKIENLISRLKQ